MLTPSASARRQSGIMLLEALIGILIFSLGILGMVSLQAASLAAAADAKYRSEAAGYADRLIAQIWLNADRTTSATLQTSLLAFRYNISGTNCAFSGGATDTTNTVLSAWVTTVTGTAGSQLPGASTAMQQVLVDTAANNRVTVTVCWQGPNDAQPRRHTMTANVS